MNDDFERAWLSKLDQALGRNLGDDARSTVMQGSSGLSADSSPEEIADWTCLAMDRLDLAAGSDAIHDIMTACSCSYPTGALEPVRKAYLSTGRIESAIEMLQEQFEDFLSQTLGLDQHLIDRAVSKGWGSAGVLEGERIIATKIPRSENLTRYLEEDDPYVRRKLYCHCPRIRSVFDSDAAALSETYCYCGGGFYRGIWELILQRPVRVGILKSLLSGDEVCSFWIDVSADS